LNLLKRNLLYDNVRRIKKTVTAIFNFLLL